MTHSLSGRPPETMLGTFQATALPVPIASGQGQSGRAGPIILKPTGMPVETAWRAEVPAALPESPDFRMATHAALGPSSPGREESDRYRPVVTQMVSRARSR